MKTCGRFIVIKRTGERPGDLSHLVFVEWRNKIPVFAPSGDLAMVFEFWDMAQLIRGKLEAELTGWLSHGWEVWDMDQVTAENMKTRQEIEAIIRDE